MLITWATLVVVLFSYPISFLGSLEYTIILYVSPFFGLLYESNFYFLTSLILGLYTGPIIRRFLENVPCSLLSGSMPWLFSPTSASPLGFVRSSLFLFYTSYLPILLLIIILYRKIYVITVIKGVQNGILNGKKERNIKKNEEKVLIFSFI